MRLIIVPVLSILISVLSAISNQNSPLFSTGWYKQSRKGNKTNVKNVSSIGPSDFPDSEYLRIGGRIPVLYVNAVHDLVKLKYLSISSSGIVDVLPGAFNNLPNISKLNLKENGIKHIKTGVFNSLSLTYLYLNKNDISVIESGAFDDMTLLQKIKLNSNKISAWDSQWFKNTPSLTLIFARRNKITELPANAFKNLIESGQKTDLKLFLSKNNIIKIDPKAFSGIKQLGQLYLDRNKLTELDKNVFNELAIIEIISLAKNQLTYLPDELLSSLSVGTLNLSFNYKLRCISAEIVKKVRTVNMEKIKINCTCSKSLEKYAKKIIRSNACTNEA
ncbi:chondroadherin-like [Anthonomus grandis grandis]|uniref:chondroadherin-like n=1 Tax=Anthonomus grandis grandis TaxID=2921223 RepID=UPI002165BA78|nr:chondroadherin-like [Anthonomus grandis grandis]